MIYLPCIVTADKALISMSMFQSHQCSISMLGDPLIYSFAVDSRSSSLGLPWCAQGIQPHIPTSGEEKDVPPPVKAYLSYEELWHILGKINEIFHVSEQPCA